MIYKENNDIITSGFLGYLGSLGLSDNSIRFYKSDLSHFSDWIISRVREMGIFAENLKEVIPFLKSEYALEYKEHLSKNQIAVKTVNRRLSTLRKFSEFLILEGLIESDFTKEIENMVVLENSSKSLLSITSDFEKYLESNKASKNTIKNYLADIKHFLSWLEKNSYAKST